MRIVSGITIRENQVRSWLGKEGFEGDYLLVSTKPESVYYKRLMALPPGSKLIVDLYTPILLEKELTLSKWKLLDLFKRWRNKQVVKKFLERGNHFLVANRRQREYWIKVAESQGVNLSEKDISVLPTGSPAVRKKEAVPAGRQEGRRKKARNIVLWFGGVYPWLNPWPLVEAFGKLAPRFPNLKLRFLGGWHPETGYKGIYKSLKELSQRLISSTQVEFVPWQLQNKLGKYLADVAFAVHLPKPTFEDYCAHRVRLLTLFTAGIPVLTSGHDVISDLAVKLGAAERTGVTETEIERDLSRLMSLPGGLSKMKKPCLWVETEFLKQEKDIQTFLYS